MKNELGLKIVKKFDLDKRFLRFSKEKRIARELNTLNDRIGNEHTLYTKYLGKKVEYLIFVFLGMVIIMIAARLMPQGESELVDGVITRNGYSAAEKSVVLIAKSEGMKTELEVLLEPLHYPKEELDLMAEDVFLYLEEEVFSKNEYGEYIINEPLRIPEKRDGYPFSILWESSNYNVLDSSGTIGEGLSEYGEYVSITVKLGCYEYVWEKEYMVRVFSVTKDWKENFSDTVKKTIEELDKTTSEERSFLLPKEIDGHKIYYEEKKDSPFCILTVLALMLMVCVWFFMDSNLQKQMEERNEQLLVDYAKFVSKLSLYLGVGLSLGTVIKRMESSADKSRYYVRELEIAMHEIDNHIAENKAIKRFADRCKLPCYIKLSVLINQNIQKGNMNLQKQLKEETKKAFEERKNLVRKHAQKAGTKLLFPMLLMLVVVMIMIMYPAFVSFTV